MNILNIIFSWQFIIAICIIVDIYYLFTMKSGSVWKYRILYNSDINLIMNKMKYMSSREFEEFIAHLFKLQGHDVQLTQETSDMGRDIIVDKDIFIECKHYDDHVAVGRPVVQKLLGSIVMFNAKKGIIINTGKYHKNAIEASKMVNNLELWDVDDVMNMVKELNTSEILRYLGYDRESWEDKDTVS